MKSKVVYEHAGVMIIHGDCRHVSKKLERKSIALVHSDNPYGINLRTNGRGSGRKVGQSTAPLKGRAFAPIAGDDKPFDPSHLLGFPRVVLWGANHFSDKLPVSPSWIVWDKREDFGSDNGGDGEMAWTNLGGPLRIFRHLWRGTCRASETGEPHLYATQKPIALSNYVFQQAKLKAGDRIFVPYLGSGPDLVAAKLMGLRVIACDLSEEAIEIAINRLRQEVLPFGTRPSSLVPEGNQLEHKVFES